MKLSLSTLVIKSSTHASGRGFTIIELLVSISIFTVLTGVVLAKYNTYNTSAPFANASEDVVLALRQAQVYGAGGKGNPAVCTGGTAFECTYGVYFSTSGTLKNGITLFVDTNNDRMFTQGTDSVIERIAWNSEISVSALSCPGPVGTCGSAVTVTFRRPDPLAFIAEVVNPANSYDSASVTLTHAISGRTANIVISKAGQISLR
ncbi:MAG: hypothetical protein UU05_C0030G0005 [Candidatus Curtissbacteria bacterium GW2011_GWA1_40_47]|uniref:Prepilin-type N-terminal cleavage/methylation domain-containing protein n=1 Tax=Candidatus Nomurabacteria bacterium GW2011_GWC2_42_20 TaxID=1618756 RepID=A0A0G1CFH9_9BACT|nr:MAG: hypothetical protein UU05_C0030G0005 [Candidatus Curtissbacteria bacterium GW2011_GWA1_40_47]KKS27077.1 MAG: hypothetical protein UU88_C0012G0011 [Parcubacteria group bacterium GW2011_GWC1_42_11]KKS48318.1 MAG: hypothetical protein UV12_C0001G0013 [Candidatus Nomurabacteria bacterium GW2011_GWC2_42_20]KKS58380.1 MAG: hypothetical protein UV24_C0024G0006 [Candidatus Nomurabacteria bacterium GW2011_GWA2_42_41]TAN35713.1 MAG: type II secretion system protein [Patescibacteria group bacteriu